MLQCRCSAQGMREGKESGGCKGGRTCALALDGGAGGSVGRGDATDEEETGEEGGGGGLAEGFGKGVERGGGRAYRGDGEGGGQGARAERGEGWR